MLVLPHTAEYAMRAVCYIAEHQGNGPVPVSTVAEALGAPRNYLSKILHQLRALGVLSSVRGTSGGYRLGHAPGEIRLAQLVAPFMPEHRHHCIMGHPFCGDDVACGAHEHWKAINDNLRRFFADFTLADLMNNQKPEPKPDVTSDSTLPVAPACGCELPHAPSAPGREVLPAPATGDSCHIRFGGIA